MKRLTTGQAAKKLKVCPQRVAARLASGHFPRASKCECGRTTMIPTVDIERDIKKKAKK